MPATCCNKPLSMYEKYSFLPLNRRMKFINAFNKLIH